MDTMDILILSVLVISLFFILLHHISKLGVIVQEETEDTVITEKSPSIVFRGG